MLLIDLITEISKNLIKLQNKNGSFPGGHNGPYYDRETPVRNTSHIIILLSKCYRFTNDRIYLDSVYKASEYLCSKEARPFGYSFYHRNKEGKDKCNGLIGQAWTIEALIELSKVLKDEKFLRLAEELFSQHIFDYDCGLWHKLEINGEVMDIDKAFNHQLWFASCSSLLYDNSKDIELRNKIKKFMDFLPENMDVNKDGLILHPVKKSYKKESNNEKSEKKVRGKEIMDVFNHVYREIFKKNLIRDDDYNKKVYKSIGYHSFNMYAFAFLKKQIPYHHFWNSELFNRTLKYMLSADYKNSLNGNSFGYPYNPPGFEVPYALNVLGNFDYDEMIELCNFWINGQIRRSYNHKTKMMDRNTTDPMTHTARIYELCRLPVGILDRISVEVT